MCQNHIPNIQNGKRKEDEEKKKTYTQLQWRKREIKGERALTNEMQTETWREQQLGVGQRRWWSREKKEDGGKRRQLMEE